MPTTFEFETESVDIGLMTICRHRRVKGTIGAFAMAIRDMDVEHGDD